MEEKQIIELYWERSEDAIKQTEEKYGQYCTYIANNILRNKEEAEKCVRESYERIWDTIPPRRPKNLKAYLGKITRYQALHKTRENENLELVLGELKDCIPETTENEKQMSEQYVIELAFDAFLKELEPTQYKLFIARYWYLASVAEIASTYRMGEAKITKILSGLRQKLKSVLEKEKVFSVDAENLLYAMTEVEDRYLEEGNLFEELGVEAVERTEDKASKKNWGMPRIRLTKGTIGVAASILVLLCITLVWPKAPVEQTPPMTESELPIEIESDGGELIESPAELVRLVDSSGSSEIISREDFIARKDSFPWKEDMQIAALPIYKNLFWHSSEEHAEFLNEKTLLSMVEEIASKLKMEVISTKVEKREDEKGTYIVGMEATTNTGAIEIFGDGYVSITFMEGIQLPEMYEMSDDATIETAKQTVGYLFDEYAQLLPQNDWGVLPYAAYDSDGNRTMNYRVVVYRNGIDGILDYYFTQANFYYNEQLGLTGIKYGDYRTAAKFIEYRPVISLEMAKNLLKNKAYESAVELSDVKGGVLDENSIEVVELMYRTGYSQAYFEPYYCFYVKLEKENTYGKFYVQATIEEVEEDLEYIPGAEPEEPRKVKILDMDGYEKLDDFVYMKDGKCFTFEKGEIKELSYVPETDSSDKYGSTITENTENGTETIFCYKDIELNLTQLLDNHYDSVNALYIDGKILIQCVRSSIKENFVTNYVYSLEDQSLKKTIDETQLYQVPTYPEGIRYYGGRYATRVTSSGTYMFIDLLEGKEINSGICSKDIKQILSAGDHYFAVVYEIGEIAIVDARNGEIVAQPQYPIYFGVSKVMYKDDMVYIETWDGKYFMFILPV